MSLPDNSLANELGGLYQAVFNCVKTIDENKESIKKYIEHMKSERYAQIYDTKLNLDCRTAIDELEASL